MTKQRRLLGLILLTTTRAAIGTYVTMEGHSLEDYPGALCLDGSPGRYYHVEGQSNTKWYIEMEGGGWCQDYRTCGWRSQGHWGSTNQDGPTRRKHNPFFDDSPSVNPMMHDWNRVYLRYCDGFSFSGNVKAPLEGQEGTEQEGTVLHLRGFDILQAAITDLLTNRNLGEATDVVIGGCSAGGLSSLLHCDRWAERIRQYNPFAKVACAPESGFFIDYNNTLSTRTYGEVMRDGFEFHQAVLPYNCLESEGDASRCVYAEHVVKYVQTPVFIMQPLYDSWARGVVQMSLYNHTEINKFGEVVQNTLMEVVKNHSVGSAKNGVWSDSCARHCGGFDVTINGIKKPEALKRWYEREGQHARDQDVYTQGKQYGCDDCCLASPPARVPSDTPSTAPTSLVLWALAQLSTAPTTKAPSSSPSQRPSLRPSSAPSVASQWPSSSPSFVPSESQSEGPSLQPTQTHLPVPSNLPSESPSTTTPTVAASSRNSEYMNSHHEEDDDGTSTEWIVAYCSVSMLALALIVFFIGSWYWRKERESRGGENVFDIGREEDAHGDPSASVV